MPFVTAGLFSLVAASFFFLRANEATSGVSCSLVARDHPGSRRVNLSHTGGVVNGPPSVGKLGCARLCHYAPRPADYQHQ